MINYVIAAWSGIRRVKDLTYIADRTHYLRNHLQQLKKLKHNLDQIKISQKIIFYHLPILVLSPEKWSF